MDTFAEVDTLSGFGYREFKFQYNKDFGKNHEENPGFPLSDTYNYCDECAGSEPNSIYYSIKGFSEDAFDNFKIILANNKFNVPSESGDITNLFLEKDQLYAHTTKALFSVQTRPQELNSNEATIQIGTGQIGSIPPKKLISVQYGYGGSDDASRVSRSHARSQTIFKRFLMVTVAPFRHDRRGALVRELARIYSRGGAKRDGVSLD